MYLRRLNQLNAQVWCRLAVSLTGRKELKSRVHFVGCAGVECSELESNQPRHLD